MIVLFVFSSFFTLLPRIPINQSISWKAVSFSSPRAPYSEKTRQEPKAWVGDNRISDDFHVFHERLTNCNQPMELTELRSTSFCTWSALFTKQPSNRFTSILQLMHHRNSWCVVTVNPLLDIFISSELYYKFKCDNPLDMHFDWFFDDSSY